MALQAGASWRVRLGCSSRDIARSLTSVKVRCRPDRWNDFRCRPLRSARVRGRIVHTAEANGSILVPPTLRALGSRSRRVAWGRIHGADIARESDSRRLTPAPSGPAQLQSDRRSIRWHPWHEAWGDRPDPGRLTPSCLTRPEGRFSSSARISTFPEVGTSTRARAGRGVDPSHWHWRFWRWRHRKRWRSWRPATWRWLGIRMS